MNLFDALQELDDTHAIKFKEKDEWNATYIVEGIMMPFGTSYLLGIHQGNVQNQYATSILDLKWEHINKFPVAMVQSENYEIITFQEMLEEIKARWHRENEDGR